MARLDSKAVQNLCGQPHLSHHHSSTTISLEARPYGAKSSRLRFSPTALRDHPLWWSGPPWLAYEHVQVPDQPTDDELATLSTLETKAVTCNTVNPVPPEWMELKCSSYHTQLCVTAWYLRAVHNFLARIRGHTKRLTKNLILTSPEIASAEHFLFTQSQQRTFPTDLAQLKATPPQPLRNSSNLLPLNPFLGKDGLLQVGGRLSNATLSPSQKHPVILGKGHANQVVVRV